MSNQNEHEQQEKQQFLPHIWAETKDAFHSKKAWALLVFFLVLLFIGGFVPVGKIPFLRNLAYAMGYTPDETQKISLLRALFSWNEHQKILRGELPDPDAVSVFGEGGGFLTSAGARAQNKLINLRAVNSSLARQGRAQDGLRDSSYSSSRSVNGQQDAGVKITDTGVSAATQANAAKVGEVYFGEDASAVARDRRDGYNSVNALKKIANPNIAGTSNGDDWFDRLVDKATRSDPGLDNIAKNIDKGGMLSKLGGVRNQNTNKAQKDMFYAWLFGRTARRTPNPVLRKTLASSGFNGGELPKSVFSASGFSGVGINPDDVVADMDDISKYIKQDKDCQEAMRVVGDSVSDKKSNLFGQIKNLKFPSNCDEAFTSTYANDLKGISAACEAVKQAYAHDLRSKCSISINQGNCGGTAALAGRFNSYLQYCREKQQECRSLVDPAEQANCVNSIQTAEQFSSEDCDPNCGAAAVSQAQQDIFYVDKDGNPVRNPDNPRDGGGFLPQLDWNSNFWVGTAD